MFGLFEIVAVAGQLVVGVPTAVMGASHPPADQGARPLAQAPHSRRAHDMEEVQIVVDPHIADGAVACNSPMALRQYVLARDGGAPPASAFCRTLPNGPYALVEIAGDVAEISPIGSGEWGNVPIVYTLASMLQLD
jgi:hypothetical protein